MPFRSFCPRLVLLAISLLAVVVDAATPGRENGSRSGHEPLTVRASSSSASSRARADPWQQLRPQMTKDDVLKVLGAPRWTDRSLLFEFWMYEVPSTLATGVVVFEKDRVFSSRPPSGPGRSP